MELEVKIPTLSRQNRARPGWGTPKDLCPASSQTPASHKMELDRVTFRALRPINCLERRTAEIAVKTVERENDDRLQVTAAQSEPVRFAELYEQNFHRVYAFIARRVGSRDRAQDLTAEVFHQALVSIGNFRWQGAPFISWLYGIAANVLASYWQKSGRNPVRLEEHWDTGGSEEIERQTILAELVESLMPDQRMVIIRRFIEQRSIREVATELGRSEGAIKQLQLRALENLREKMGKKI